ncbi:MAG: CHAD domain-containing protein [Nitrosomonadales bacterium]|nr:CHAD domain-containing protein [Nitrosomonadales bacterium]
MNTLDAERLHAMRILAKKPRYSAEFFSGIYGRKKSRAFLWRSARCRRCSARSNELLRSRIVCWTNLRLTGACRRIRRRSLAAGWIANDLELRQFASLHKIVRRFARQRPFWEKIHLGFAHVCPLR